MGRQFLDLADAAMLEIVHYLLARRAVLDAVERGVMVVIMQRRLGKSYVVDELVQEQALRLLWTSLPSRLTPALAGYCAGLS